MKKKMYTFEVVLEGTEYILIRYCNKKDTKEIGVFSSEEEAIVARDKERNKEEKRIRRNKKAKAGRIARKMAMESLGLRHVKGALGGSYWE
jgi:hypothetical protein